MRILYSCGIFLYGQLLRLAALRNPKARQWVAGRRNLFKRLENALQGNTAPLAWFHCASLGEFEQARPVLEQFRQTHAHYRILLTFFSPSGYEVRKNYDHADWVFYLPLDTAANARRFVATVRPALAFFAKYEFWHHYLAELRRQAVPTFLFSAIFRQNQPFFKPWGGFFRNMLRCFTHIFVQNEASAQLLAGIGIRTVTVAGDTRIDRVSRIAQTKLDLPLVSAFRSHQPLLVVGSTWPGDLAVVLPFVSGFAQPLKVVLAPHEISEETLRYIEQTLPKRILRYSVATETTAARADVLLVDNVGLLASMYQYGDFAYVGGGFIDGIHNILEPAVFGMPVFFGPNYHKFQEAHDLIALGVAHSVKDAASLASAFESLYADEA
ncbi:MAG: 3-deoxy-D-manno-octulosonic acid transferase, partial [Cytophagales bacterium]|nr:3-deoxy-D-manno-octulosonic acid transferase [Cytophagales bacterium]